MTSTFELNRQYEEWLLAIEANHGEINDESESHLAELMKGVENKGEAIFFMVRKCESMIEECKTLEADFKAQKQKWENKKKRVQEMLKTLLEIKGETEEKPTFEGAWGKAYLTKRKAVVISDNETVLESFGIEKVVRSIDRAALKKHLQAGNECEGASLVETVSASIRSR